MATAVSAGVGGRAPFQVLALDGGGYKGIFAAAVLAAVEQAYNVEVTSHFDLVVGTSAGGIIALALGAGRRPFEIVDFFVANGKDIFPRSPVRSIRWLFRAKYQSEPLSRALRLVLGDALLLDACIPIVVPSYELDNSEVHLFKTRHHERLTHDWRIRMVDVALATSAAPTYFPAHDIDSVRLVDGGLWANNPVMVGLVEAVSLFGARLEDIRILSVGTTQDTRKRSGKLARGGLLAWRKDAIDLALRGQSAGSNAMAEHLLGKDRVVRIDPAVPPNLFALDRLTTAGLISRANAISRHFSPAIEGFLRHTPIRPGMLNTRPSVAEA
jgi:patatin-like phospholipase/acyl hydrolase